MKPELNPLPPVKCSLRLLGIENYSMWYLMKTIKGTGTAIV